MNIAHFADAHIGVTTHGKVDAETGLNDRVLDFLDAFDFIIDYVEEHSIDLAMFAGDLFHSNNPSPALVSEVAIRIKELSQLCPLVMVPGNHDQAMNRVSAVDVFSVLEMENVYVSDSPKNYIINTKHGDVFIGALPFPTFSMFGIHGRTDEAKLELVQAVDECIWEWLEITNDKPEIPRILLAHGTVSGASYGKYKGAALGHDVQLVRENLQHGWDYVALGHIHLHQDLTKYLRNMCPVVYSGSIERVDFGEQDEPKGFVHVNISEGNTTYKFVEIPVRPMETIRIDTREAKHPDFLVETSLRKWKIYEDSIVRIIIDANDVLDIDVVAIYREMDWVHRIAQVQVNVERKDIQRLELEEGETIADLTHEELLEEYLVQQDTEDAEIDVLLDLWDELQEDL